MTTDSRAGIEALHEAARRRERNPVVNFLQILFQKRLGFAGGILIVGIIIVAIFADAFATYDPLESHVSDRLKGPRIDYRLGTDNFGRDVFSRVVHGSRISLTVGMVSVLISVVGGTLIGVLCGHIRGRFDLVMQRAMDSLMAFPSIIMALAIMSALGPSLTNVILAIGIVHIPGLSRVVRGTTLSVEENQYIEAARTVGCGTYRLITFHVLPNIMAPIIVIATAWLGDAILIEASLSFLGLGTPPPAPSWGGMLSGAAQQYLERAPWLALAPGLAISIAVLGFNLFGDALRDIWDPRLRGSR